MNIPGAHKEAVLDRVGFSQACVMKSSSVTKISCTVCKLEIPPEILKDCVLHGLH